MTEIDGKKYYTWDEIRAMPFGTKFKLYFGAVLPFTFKREDNGSITMGYVTSNDRYINTDAICFLMLQDRFELYEEKPEREYVTGCQALEKLISGEWKKIACDSLQFDIKYFHSFGFNNSKEACISARFLDGLVVENAVEKLTSLYFLALKKWYEYKDTK